MQTLFSPITKFFETIFLALYDFVVGLGVTGGAAYVLAIVILTVIIRAILLPFNIKAAKSTQRMQEAQPEIKKIQAKYKSDPQKSGAEVMKYNKENNISMTGGCLPSLLPLPILMALYYTFFNMEITGSFLWIADLGQSDKFYILPVLAALSTYVPSYLMSKSTPPAAQGGMNMGTMSIAMAGMMGFMALNFKSILVIYWVLGGIIQVGTTYFINYRPAMVKKTKVLEVEAKVEAARTPRFVMNEYEGLNNASKKKKKK